MTCTFCKMTGVFYVPMRNNSQHRKWTLEKKILLPFLTGLQLTTFWSWVWFSTKKLSQLPQSKKITLSNFLPYQTLSWPGDWPNTNHFIHFSSDWKIKKTTPDSKKFTLGGGEQYPPPPPKKKKKKKKSHWSMAKLNKLFQQMKLSQGYNTN